MRAHNRVSNIEVYFIQGIFESDPQNGASKDTKSGGTNTFSDETTQPPKVTIG